MRQLHLINASHIAYREVSSHRPRKSQT